MNNATAMLGRGVAAVGIVLGFVAIWSSYAPGFKYSDDGTIMAWLLIFAILAAGLVLGAVATGRRELDVWTGVAGGVMFGFYLLIPVFAAFSQWKNLNAGAWLGVCSGLSVLGVLLATWAPFTKTAQTPNPVGVVLAVVGLVLVFVGIFPTLETGHGSYWSLTGLGHSGGIFLIILVVLGALLLLATWMGWPLGDWMLLLAAITFGFTTAIIVGEAFNHLGNVKTGGWLGAAGGLLTLLGAVAMRQTVPAGADASVPTAVAPPAPPA